MREEDSSTQMKSHEMDWGDRESMKERKKERKKGKKKERQRAGVKRT